MFSTYFIDFSFDLSSLFPPEYKQHEWIISLQSKNLLLGSNRMIQTCIYNLQLKQYEDLFHDQKYGNNWCEKF